MPVYIGVDLHVRTQAVCWCDTADGEIRERELVNSSEEMEAFYAQFTEPATVGVESVGYRGWFHRLMEAHGHGLLVGDAAAIRSSARRRQKNDRRDAALLLDLLLEGKFPSVHVPSPESQQVVGLLRYRHRLVKVRTMLRNGLQAVALNHQLRLGRSLLGPGGRMRLLGLKLEGAEAEQRKHSLALVDELHRRILVLEQELEERAAGDSRVWRLRTHPGVGLLTALAAVHLLEPVQRFSRGRKLAAYCGLDPMEHSSGDRQRFGHISKQGNRLLRFLLVEAAHVAVVRDPELGRFYRRLAVRKNRPVAVAAAARKLVIRLYTMLRDQIDYEEFRRRGRDARCARKPHSPELRG